MGIEGHQLSRSYYSTSTSIARLQTFGVRGEKLVRYLGSWREDWGNGGEEEVVDHQ